MLTNVSSNKRWIRDCPSNRQTAGAGRRSEDKASKERKGWRELLVSYKGGLGELWGAKKG